MKKAFSLIELMIVIVIIGVVYTLVVTKLKNYNEEKAPLSLATLKTNLAQLAKKADGVATLWCFDGCQKCAIYVKNTKIKEIPQFFDEGSEVAMYRYDYLSGMTSIEPDVFFDKDDVQQDVCFSFGVDTSGVSDQVLVVYKEKVYDYTNYFTAVDMYDSLEDAATAKEQLIEEVKR